MCSKNRSNLKSLSTGILSILLAGISLNSLAQTDSLYKASVFTPKMSFTHGVEGPASDKSGTVYAVNFGSEGTIGQITPAGEPSLFVTLPEGSDGNGIRFDAQGNMLIADYKKHNVLKVDMKTKNITVLAHEDRMTQPNDIAIDSRGIIYASDPDFKTKTGRIWRVVNGKFDLLDSADIGPANGIDVSPNGKILYVNAQRKVWAYDLAKDGSVSNRRLLKQFDDFGMDGMRCDVKGNLYIARIGKSAVVKLSPKGEVLQEIKLTGRQPTNIAFGGKDGRTVYVTLMDQGNLESFRVDDPGRETRMKWKN